MATGLFPRRVRTTPVTGQGAVRLATGNPLTRAAAFCYVGHLSQEILTGTKPTIATNASKRATVKGPSWHFTGTTPSNLNFGSIVATRNLDISPTGATWAFLAQVPATTNLALADQSGNGGWAVQYRSRITFSAYRPTNDLTQGASDTIPANLPFTLVVVYNGVAGDLAANFNIYLNGQACSLTGSTNGSGVRPSETNSLYLGEAISGFPNTVMTGDIDIAYMSAFPWSDAQIKSWALNQWQLFEPVHMPHMLGAFSSAAAAVSDPPWMAAQRTLRNTLLRM